MSAGAGDGRPGLTSHQLRLLRLMAEAAKLSPEAFLDGVVRALPGVTGYDDLDEARFDTIADAFVAIGFRHPALPLLSAAQRTWVDRCRRRAGMSGREAVTMFRHSTGTTTCRAMTGSHLLGLLGVFEMLGAAEPLPRPGFMNRGFASALRLKARACGVSYLDLVGLVMKFGGGFRMRDLDARAYGRVMIALGSVNPGPAPTVEGAPGMVTQAQANVIWRLWQDARRGRDASEQALDIAIGLLLGFSGGLDTLTRAGVRAVLDGFKASMDEQLDLTATRPGGRITATKSGLPC